jgi:TPR repeat protein
MGNAKAQCNLSELYRSGRGVKQDFAEAAKWKQKSTERGLKCL